MIADAAHDPMIGQLLDKYRIVVRISVGGMGTIYGATHELLGRRAAVKVLHPEMSQSHDIINRFFNEAKATTAIRHPGIVEIFDFGYMASGHAYIVMEYLEGKTLAVRSHERGRVHEGEAAMILRGVSSALAAAHALGIVHRDLKPDNIFMLPDGGASSLGERTKLLDFGIAKLTEPGIAGSATKTGAVMGTPTYMSPEQCRGTGDVDHRADLYSLGCIFYELVTGRPPFTHSGAGELIGSHLYVQPEPASRHAPGVVTPETDALIMRLLDKDPARRVQTARELGVLLTAIAQRHGWTIPATDLDAVLPETAPKPLTAPMPAAVPPRAATPLPIAVPRTMTPQPAIAVPRTMTPQPAMPVVPAIPAPTRIPTTPMPPIAVPRTLSPVAPLPRAQTPAPVAAPNAPTASETPRFGGDQTSPAEPRFATENDATPDDGDAGTLDEVARDTHERAATSADVSGFEDQEEKTFAVGIDALRDEALMAATREPAPAPEPMPVTPPTRIVPPLDPLPPTAPRVPRAITPAPISNDTSPQTAIPMTPAPGSLAKAAPQEPTRMEPFGAPPELTTTDATVAVAAADDDTVGIRSTGFEPDATEMMAAMPEELALAMIANAEAARTTAAAAVAPMPMPPQPFAPATGPHLPYHVPTPNQPVLTPPGMYAAPPGAYPPSGGYPSASSSGAFVPAAASSGGYAFAPRSGAVDLMKPPTLSSLPSDRAPAPPAKFRTGVLIAIGAVAFAVVALLTFLIVRGGK